MGFITEITISHMTLQPYLQFYLFIFNYLDKIWWWSFLFQDHQVEFWGLIDFWFYLRRSVLKKDETFLEKVWEVKIQSPCLKIAVSERNLLERAPQLMFNTWRLFAGIQRLIDITTAAPTLDIPCILENYEPLFWCH